LPTEVRKNFDQRTKNQHPVGDERWVLMLFPFLVVRTSLSLAIYPAERGPGGAPGETPNQLSARAS